MAYTKAMLFGFRPPPISDSVRRELVTTMHAAALPSIMMTVAFASVGSVVAVELASPATGVVVAVGLIAMAMKIVLIMRFGRQRDGTVAVRDAEMAFAISTFGFALALGIFGAIGFVVGDAGAQMLISGLLFAYCAGLVARVSMRPWICYTAIPMTTLPIAAAAAYEGHQANWLMAAMLVMFMLGSFGSVQQAYVTFVRMIVLQQESMLLAHHDPLTGLANRIGLRHAFDRLRIDPVPMLAVHCLDLDRFKPVNDRYGHPVGDAVLRLIGQRIRDALRPGDIAARTGGDEFVIVQAPIHRAEEAEIFARRLIRAIVTPCEIDGRTIELGVSIGYAVSPPDPRDLDMLVETSDIALYRMKAAGGSVSCGGRLMARVSP